RQRQAPPDSDLPADDGRHVHQCAAQEFDGCFGPGCASERTDIDAAHRPAATGDWGWQAAARGEAFGQAALIPNVISRNCRAEGRNYLPGGLPRPQMRRHRRIRTPAPAQSNRKKFPPLERWDTSHCKETEMQNPSSTL